MPQIETYKDEQKRQKAALKKRTVIWYGKVPANFGIRAFKRENPGKPKLHAQFKAGMWDTVRKMYANQEAEK